ncbi:MAG: hypothetical protein SVK08_02030 [Halobacteriota archaeon]|nr:hypothetical protein [Halobacteriota archaeon]
MTELWVVLVVYVTLGVLFGFWASYNFGMLNERERKLPPGGEKGDEPRLNLSSRNVPKAFRMVGHERMEQIAVLGFDKEHDSQYMETDALERAAACYLLAKSEHNAVSPDGRDSWPVEWAPRWDNRTQSTRMRCLVKAAALTLAAIDVEIHRLERDGVINGPEELGYKGQVPNLTG